MLALQITATTPHGVVLSRPWGMALDGLLASVLWHRRKWTARAAGQFTLGKCIACGGCIRAGEHAEARRPMDSDGQPVRN